MFGKIRSAVLILIALVSLLVGGVVVVRLLSSVSRDSTPIGHGIPSTVTSAGAAEVTPNQPVMTYIYNAPESALDRRYDYHWEILKTALDRTTARYGPYLMQASVGMSERRQAFELREASGKITVMYLGATPDMERSLVPIRIPVDKNLSGYMVFMIRKQEQPRFAAIRTLDELKQLSIGLGLGWIDVDILRSDQFKVVTGSSYDGLFEMLVNRRFDVFSRSAVEIIGEFEARHTKLPTLAIEDTLLLYYPLPMYFWFSKNEAGRRLAERATEGMLSMIEDGTYDQIFFKYQQVKIDSLHLKNRRIFKIPNPYLGPETPFGDKRLWFDPTDTPRVRQQ